MTNLKQVERWTWIILLFISLYLISLSLFNIYKLSSQLTFIAEAIFGYLLFLIISLKMFPSTKEYFDFQKSNLYLSKRVRRTIYFGIVGGMVFLIYFIILFKIHGFDFTLESVEIYEQSEFSQIVSNVFLSVGSGILTAFGIRLYQYHKREVGQS